MEKQEVKHFVITRFLCYNFRGCSDESLFEPQRLKSLYDRLINFFIPTMENQKNKNFECIIMIHDNIDKDLIKYLYEIKSNLKITVLRKSELHSYIDPFFKEYKHIITTRIDCDDLVHESVVDEVQHKAKTVNNIFLYGYDICANMIELSGKVFKDRNPGYCKNKTGFRSMFESLIVNTNTCKATPNIYDLGNHTKVIIKLKELYPDIASPFYEFGKPYKCIYIKHEGSDSNNMNEISHPSKEKINVNLKEFGVSI